MTVPVVIVRGMTARVTILGVTVFRAAIVVTSGSVVIVRGMTARVMLIGVMSTPTAGILMMIVPAVIDSVMTRGNASTRAIDTGAARPAQGIAGRAATEMIAAPMIGRLPVATIDPLLTGEDAACAIATTVPRARGKMPVTVTGMAERDTGTTAATGADSTSTTGIVVLTSTQPAGARGRMIVETVDSTRIVVTRTGDMTGVRPVITASRRSPTPWSGLSRRLSSSTRPPMPRADSWTSEFTRRW